MNKVVIDANVLYSNTLRNLFLWLSWNKLCDIVWSEEIWEEVFRNYSEDPGKKGKFKQHIQSVVFHEFFNCMKMLNKPFNSLGLPDPDDEHVVALALQNSVVKIITFNKKDFPDHILLGQGIQVIHPDDFLCELWGNFPEEIKSVLQQTIRSYTSTKPEKSAYFASLKKAKACQFAEVLEEEDETESLFPEVW